MGIGAVFSTSSCDQNLEVSAEQDGEFIVKATQYVEKAPVGSLRCRYYVVFESEFGRKYVSEMLVDGTVAWKVNPEDIEDRNSLAKVLSAAECQGTTVTSLCSHLAAMKTRTKTHKSKQFARAAFRHVSASR